MNGLKGLFPVQAAWIVIVSILMWSGPVPDLSFSGAEEISVVTGRVSDAGGKAVGGAMVFVYGSPDVRRTADYISGRTDGEGMYRVSVPRGKYWAVARLKKKEGFGPLMPGDRHSGEPVVIDATGEGIRADFTIMDLREAIALKRKDREAAVRISGRILDEKGASVMNAFALANRSEIVSGYPDYISSWVDEQGRYAIYLPRGTYNMGAATDILPEKGYVMTGKMTFLQDMTDVDLVVKKPGTGQ